MRESDLRICAKNCSRSFDTPIWDRYRPARSSRFCLGVAMTESDDRRAIANAMRWASQVTSLGMELAVPAGVGVWLDSKYDTLPGFTLVGVCFGSYLAFRGLQKLLRDLDK